jgi:hypothetical protein
MVGSPPQIRQGLRLSGRTTSTLAVIVFSLRVVFIVGPTFGLCLVFHEA